VELHTSEDDQFTAHRLRNEYLQMEFIPELGAKMSSLRSLVSGREFLLPPSRPYRRPAYSDDFAQYDTSGFDECCPTVSACEYPSGRFAGRLMPDHGDLWSTPWQCEVKRDELFCEVQGRCLPYIFRKRAHLELSTAVLSYEIENVGDDAFSWLWSAHPLLAVESGCRVVLPSEVTTLFVNWSSAERLGKFGANCLWPIARDKNGTKVDLSRFGSSVGAADKLFTSRLSVGECGVMYPQTDESLSIRFDPKVVPYLGLWICQGGWPSRNNGHFTLALEPCTGRPDSLQEAMKAGECDLLQPGQRVNWELRFEVRQGDRSQEQVPQKAQRE
jgi:hypothetical protein